MCLPISIWILSGSRNPKPRRVGESAGAEVRHLKLDRCAKPVEAERDEQPVPLDKSAVSAGFPESLSEEGTCLSALDVHGAREPKK